MSLPSSSETEARQIMNSRSFIVFVCLVVAAAAFVFSTIDQLPETVATHYGAGGRANGWMTRSGYLLFMMVFLLGFSTLVSFLIGFIPHMLPSLTSIPNRDYWLAEERREGLLQFLSSHGWWLGCLIVLLSGSMHYAILEAKPTRRRSQKCRLTRGGALTKASCLTIFSRLFLTSSVQRRGTISYPTRSQTNLRTRPCRTLKRSSALPLAGRSVAATLSIPANCTRYTCSRRFNDKDLGIANPCRRFYEALGGERLRDKQINVGGRQLVEIAYGWRDARTLLTNPLGSCND